ncbi:uncharacterized protein LACBIDRAFT_309700 [Laccaria bicolor S238N-H82]|uniref:Predicted protein n=1 Tax=Laccaria bicolor (strain S238N-H82 / ATCC MYA-4686) TaxID=486041 RepID=B0DSV7_LACBS|nr:uncharacterized protein LACBIDRAFT_309700 [Laccaria bicolor S238N-H82]EDR02310.1 predicted protein [Laccaria bicolor S238N-H82]|eukprot:XP_001886987.1 predicted protein [Laccaria bicolor S238N-H82]
MFAPPPIVVVPPSTLYPTACLYVLAAGITVSVRVQASRGCVYEVKEVSKVYDYFLTLKQEISYVWSCPRSIGLALFYISRYLIFIDQPLMLYVELPAALAQSPHVRASFILIRVCDRSMILLQTRRHVQHSRHLRLVRPLRFLLLPAIGVHRFSVSMMVGFMSSQGVPILASDVSLMQSFSAIITLRTCAMWGRRLWVLVILGTLTTITFGLALYTMVSTARSIISMNRTITMPGCKFPPTGKFYVAWFCLTTLTEFTIVSLTVTKAYQHLRQSTSDWLNQLYRNGIFYSVCALPSSISLCLPSPSCVLLSSLLLIAEPFSACTFLAATIREHDGVVRTCYLLSTKDQFPTTLNSPTRVAHSIIGNRVMLLLVEHRHQTLQQNLESSPSIPEFGLPTNLDVFLTTFDADEDLSNDPNSRAGTLEVEWII